MVYEVFLIEQIPKTLNMDYRVFFLNFIHNTLVYIYSLDLSIIMIDARIVLLMLVGPTSLSVVKFCVFVLI